ncbi:MAG: LysR family transcriptional regulator [Lachnospiraceae bacterium]|nr:LysR family transcriptional regulator [Candidatus Equihabitans merdae]
MEFKHLQSFVEVVRTASFTKAAENLFISQPTISMHIQQLEEELETRLIIRTTKSLEVTPHGMTLFNDAVNILEMKNRMIANCSTGKKRIISLGASTIPSTYILPEVLPEYGRLFPETYFNIHQGDSGEIIEGIDQGVYDLGLVGMDVSRENITCLPFCEDRMVVITPVNQHYLALKSDKADLHTLLNEPIILRENGSGSQKRASMLLETFGISEDSLNVVARLNDQEAIKNMVAGGLGISIISEKAASRLIREKRLLSFNLPDDSSVRHLYVAHRKGFVLSNDTKDFIKFLKNFYK